jgi:ABC-type Fe3+/spermidine/putrescine transport system ATPase subunit
MPSVRLDELRKEFGTTVAVDDISVEFHDGKLTSILGPSGCGKTTTLNLIAGFIDPDGGTIRFGEQLIADATRGMVVPPNRRNLGMVFQSYALWPHLSVADNVAYGLKMRRMARQRRDETVRRALQRVRLGQYLDRFPHELSGGQQQRVALARDSTSRSPTSMRNCAKRCGWSSRTFITRSVSPPSTSRTTRRRP